MLAAIVLLPSASADDASDRLRALIGDGTYAAAGLDGLTEQEQAVLEVWLNERLLLRPVPIPGATVSYTVPGMVPAGTQSRRVTEAVGEGTFRTRLSFGLDYTGRDSMESFIDGEFRGWDGETEFRLRNGTIWQQVNPNERLVVPTPEMNPAVTIERGYFGYRMRVEGYNSRVQVRRLE